MGKGQAGVERRGHEASQDSVESCHICVSSETMQTEKDRQRETETETHTQRNNFACSFSTPWGSA